MRSVCIIPKSAKLSSGHEIAGLTGSQASRTTMWFANLYLRWLCFKCAVVGWLRPTLLSNHITHITFDDLVDGHKLVTFEFQGRLYRGHLPPTSRLIPYFPRNRCSMKRPTTAFDEAGKNVTEVMRQHWGPMGDWNRCIGLDYIGLVEGRGAVRVQFNDLSSEIL